MITLLARPLRRIAVPIVAATCPSCDAAVLAGTSLCGSCGAPVPARSHAEMLARLLEPGVNPTSRLRPALLGSVVVFIILAIGAYAVFHAAPPEPIDPVERASDPATLWAQGRSGPAASTGVEAAGATTVDVAPRRARLTPGATVWLGAVTADQNGSPVVARAIDWTSDAPEIATVSSTGAVTGVAPGDATITARTEAGSASAVVTVVGPSRLSPVVASTGAVKPREPRAPPIPSRPHVVDAAAPPILTTTSRAAAPAVLQMLVTPWASVSVDGGAAMRRARGADTLGAGTPHRLRFERLGFATIDTTVTLQPGERRTLEVQMTPTKP